MPHPAPAKWTSEHNGCPGCERALKMNHAGQHYVAKRVKPKPSLDRSNVPGRIKLRVPARYTITERFACTNKARLRGLD